MHLQPNIVELFPQHPSNTSILPFHILLKTRVVTELIALRVLRLSYISCIYVLFNLYRFSACLPTPIAT